MKLRFFSPLCILIFAAFWVRPPLAGAQAAGAGVAADGGVAADTQTEGVSTPRVDTLPFPLTPLLLSAISGVVYRQLDWPAAVPYDVFNLITGTAAAISLRGEAELRMRLKNGKLVEFPALIGGALRQVAARYASVPQVGGPLAAFTLDGEAPCEFEALEWDADGRPLLVRAREGENWFFVSIDFRPSEVLETWFAYIEAPPPETEAEPTAKAEPEPAAKAEAGAGSAETQASGAASAVLLAVYHALVADAPPNAPPAVRRLTRLYPEEALLERRHFDSMGNITQLETPAGVFTALYTGRGLRYEGERYFQWDERGLVVAGTAPADSPSAGGPPLGGPLAGAQSVQYEYSFDARGNWTERRELRLSALSDTASGAGTLFVPVKAAIVRRAIEY